MTFGAKHQDATHCCGEIFGTKSFVDPLLSVV